MKHFLVGSKQRRKYVGMMSKTKQKAAKLIEELNDTVNDQVGPSGTSAGSASSFFITMDEFQRGEFPWALGAKGKSILR